MTNTQRLFESVSLGNTILNNRVGVAPMTRTSATKEGFVTDKMISYYTSFAKGGFGLIITEGTYTDGFWCKKSSKLGHTDTIILKKGHDQYGKPKFVQMETLPA